MTRNLPGGIGRAFLKRVPSYCTVTTIILASTMNYYHWHLTPQAGQAILADAAVIAAGFTVPELLLLSYRHRRHRNAPPNEIT